MDGLSPINKVGKQFAVPRDGETRCLSMATRCVWGSTPLRELTLN
jgi:hypothetical protein